MSRLSALLLLCVCVTVAACAADWPQFHGPEATGFSRETGLNKSWTDHVPATLWKVPMHDNGYAGPAVADGKVFIIDHQDKQDIVRALDVKTGAEVWTFAYPDAAGDNYGFSRSTPTFNAGKLYVAGRQGQIFCLDATTGAKCWSHDLVAEFGARLPNWLYTVSPLIDGDQLIVEPGGPNATLVALKKDTGAVIWKGGGDFPPNYATPRIATLNGIRQYVTFTQKALIGVDTTDGHLLWSYPWATGCDVNAASPVIGGNMIFITSGYGHGCAMIEITAQGPVKRWENKSMQSHFSTPLGYQGHLYGSSDPGKLVCLDAKDGSVCWEQKGFEKGPVLGLDDAFIALDGRTGDCVLVKFDPAAYTELARFKPLGGQSWTAPILANGKLIVRNKTTLACIDLK